MLGDNTGGGALAAVDRVPVFWSLDFSWCPLYIYLTIYTIYVQFTFPQYLTCAGELSASCYCGFIFQWISSITHICLVRNVALFVFLVMYHSVYLVTLVEGSL